MKSKYSICRFRSSTGASLVTAIVVCLSGAAFAANWTGTTSTNWETISNWDSVVGYAGSNAVVNTTPANIATITSDFAYTPVDIIVADGAGTNGRVNHLSGIAKTGGGNWMYVGDHGGTGIYNLANTAAAGGGISGFAQGSGSINVGGRLYVGGFDGSAGGTGTFNMNTTGTLSAPAEFHVGTAGGSGTFNLESGTLNAGLTVLGDASSGSTGTLNMSGGTMNINGEMWLSNNGGATGTLNFSGGAININNWVAIGRTSGTGILTMTGGTLTKTGGGNFLVNGNGASGTMNMSGGLVDVQAGQTWIPESGTGTMTLSATAEFRTGTMTVGVNGGSTGNLNLNGGTLKIGQLTGGGGTENVIFNGTQIIATAANAAFINTLDNATISSSTGLRLDTSGFDETIPQLLSGSGGIVKSGLGTLTLTGANTYTGPTTVNAGQLAITTDSAATGAISLANNTALSVTQTAMDDNLSISSLTLGAAAGNTTLNFNLGGFEGNTAVAPLNVTGAPTLNGVVTINIADSVPALGPIPLISYVGPKAGSGSFVLGTLPYGVVATLGDNGTGLVSLNVTRINAPYWSGAESDQWNTSAVNWIDDYSDSDTQYKDGDPALFDDRLSYPFVTDVILNTTVTPGSGGVTFANIYQPYTLSGTGKISGTAGLRKEGAESLTINTLNDYTGVTTLAGGITYVDTLANGGVASPMGKSSAAATNLVLAGGALAYVGPAVSIDRGFTTTALDSAIGTADGLTLTGAAVSNGAGNLTKAGPGSLTLSYNGANTFGGGNDYGLGVLGGTLTLDGTSGTQSNAVAGELRIGFDPGVSANAVFTNTTVSNTGFLTVGRGNGSGATSSLIATNSTITSGAFSSGYDAGLAGNNASTQDITLNSTNWTVADRVLLAESSDAITNMTFAGTSQVNVANRFLMANGTGTVTNLTIKDSASLTKSGEYMSIGVLGAATVSLQNAASLTASGDFNVADVGGSKGTLNLKDTATVNATGKTYWGKGANSISAINISGGTYNGNIGEVASNGTATTTVTQTGGTVVFGANQYFYLGQDGKATWNQSAGNTTCNGYLVIGRGGSGVADWNITGGTLIQNPPNPGEYPGLVLAEAGKGTVTISNGGVLISNGQQVNIASTSTGNGTLNLNTGGTLCANRILQYEEGGTSAVNFDGGTLVANTDANPDFMTGIDTTTVKSHGVTIDSSDKIIAISVPLVDGTGGGGLTKIGAGGLGLMAANTYTGTTLVSAGTLGGVGSVAGPLVVSANAVLAPGVPVDAPAGTFTSGAATISGTYACEIDGAASDKLVVNGALNVSAGKLVISQVSTPTAAVYLIASYTTGSTGPFSSVTGVPSGYTLDYNYQGAKQIALVQTSTPYGSWISGYFAGVTDPTIIGSNADPDGDGATNLAEFALNGNPKSGTSSGKVVSKVATVGGVKALVLSLPVRTGATFSGSPQLASGLVDGLVYTIQGSYTLADMNLPISEVTGSDKTAIESTLPAMGSTAWTYRTFTSGPVGAAPKGFIRAAIVKP